MWFGGCAAESLTGLGTSRARESRGSGIQGRDPQADASEGAVLVHGRSRGGPPAAAAPLIHHAVGVRRDATPRAAVRALRRRAVAAPRSAVACTAMRGSRRPMTSIGASATRRSRRGCRLTVGVRRRSGGSLEPSPGPCSGSIPSFRLPDRPVRTGPVRSARRSSTTRASLRCASSSRGSRCLRRTTGEDQEEPRGGRRLDVGGGSRRRRSTPFGAQRSSTGRCSVG